MADVKWIKITTDIFDDEKILLIESMPAADSIISIWFKLLVLAGKQNRCGMLMMANRIPYTDEMLATIFRRDVGTVRLALTTFEQFGMIEIIDGVITISNWEKHQNVEGMEKIREQTRIRVANYRQKQIAQDVTLRNVTVTEQNKNKKEEKEEDIEIEKTNKHPLLYFPNDERLDSVFADFVENRKKLRKPMTNRAIELAISKVNQLSGGDRKKAADIINQSILNGWAGLFDLQESYKKTKGIDWDNV